MSKFNVGDRVRVFGALEFDGHWFGTSYEGEKGTVTVVNTNYINGALSVELDNVKTSKGFLTRSLFHVSSGQCRKLKKKERRRVWVNIYEKAPHSFAYPSKSQAFAGGVNAYGKYCAMGDEPVEFIEVRKKK